MPCAAPPASHWCSKGQPVTALSSTDAELYAASAAAADTLAKRGLGSEIGLDMTDATVLWCDNTGAVAVASDTGAVSRCKHMARRAHFLQDCMDNGEIRVRYLATDRQPADLLTKPLDRGRFVKLRDYLMNTQNQVVNVA